MTRHCSLQVTFSQRFWCCSSIFSKYSDCQYLWQIPYKAFFFAYAIMSILRLPLQNKNHKVSTLQNPSAPNGTSLPVFIYRKGISVPSMQDPLPLGRDWGHWPGCPGRGVAAGIVLWRDGAGAAGSSCCVLDCQHSHEGRVKPGTRSFGWILFSVYRIICLVLYLG